MEQLLVASAILAALFLARSAYRAGLRIYGIVIGITGVLGHLCWLSDISGPACRFW